MKYKSLINNREQLLQDVVKHKELTYKQLSKELGYSMHSLHSFIQREGLQEYFVSNTSPYNDKRRMNFSDSEEGRHEYEGVSYRSQLELSFIRFMSKIGRKLSTGEVFKYSVEYLNKKGRRSLYFPDFVDIERGYIYEIKPAWRVNEDINRLKFRAAKEKYGDKFKVITEELIYECLGFAHKIESELGK